MIDGKKDMTNYSLLCAVTSEHDPEIIQQSKAKQSMYAQEFEVWIYNNNKFD